MAGDGDSPVLSHGDVVLLRSDLAVLRGPHFVNDRIIAFYFAHLASDLDLDLHDVLLLPPSIPYLLSHLPDPASVAEPLRLASRRFALLPVNDNPDPSLAEGGSHWTLLVLHNPTTNARAPPRLVHHDSLAGANLPAARRLAAALDPLLPAPSTFLQGPTPMQRNPYDCGVYVMAVARAICHWWTTTVPHGHGDGGEADWFDAVRREVTADSVSAMRGELLHLIQRLIQDKAKGEQEQAQQRQPSGSD